MSLKKDEQIKTIRIIIIIPFSFPFTQKLIKLQNRDHPISVFLNTHRRSDILDQFFPPLHSFNFFINDRQLPNFDLSKNFTWLSNDRFGQLNFTSATFYFFATEKNIDDIKKAMEKKYLPLCVDVINRISTGYRLLTNTYFPRNVTKNDIIAYRLAFSQNKNDYYEEKSYRNVDFQDSYPDDKPTIDISDFLKYDKNIWLHTELILNAEDFFMEYNYRMSIIEADIAIESIIYSILEKYYSSVTMDTQVREIFLKELLKNRIDEVVKRYLNLISSNLTGFKITESKEWGKWKNKCHDIRNDVMHQRKKPEVSQAQDALSSAKALLELLKDSLYDENDWILEATAFINDREKAKKYLHKSENDVKPNADAYYYLGNIDYEDKKFDTAREYYEKALEVS